MYCAAYGSLRTDLIVKAIIKNLVNQEPREGWGSPKWDSQFTFPELALIKS